MCSLIKLGLVTPFLMFLLVGAVQQEVRAQAMDIHISVISVSPPRIRIEGKRHVATRVWSFRNAYAGLLGLGERIENLTLTDSSDVDVPVRKLASGEYESARNAIGWVCEIKLDPPALAADAAYVSPTVLVYQKGMLVAFLYDLSLRRLTSGKRMLDDVYRALFRDSTASAARREGNEVVLGILRAQDELQEFVRKYVENADEINLQTMVAPFGLTVERMGARTRFAVSEKLSSQERDLLRAFGYNKETRRDRRRVS